MASVIATRVYVSIARRATVAAFVTLALVFGLLPVRGWITEASGNEMVLLQMVWVATMVAGIATSIFSKSPFGLRSP